MSDDLVAKVAMLTYALYRTSNLYRHKAVKPTPEIAFDSMEHYLRTGPVGHCGCTKTLDSVWSKGPAGDQKSRRRCRKRPSSEIATANILGPKTSVPPLTS